MMKLKNIIFVGSQNLGNPPDDGETMKNAILVKAISSWGYRIIKIDVRNRFHRYYYLVKFIFCLVFIRNANIVFSSSSFVAYKLIYVAKALKWKGKKIVYWVIGGNFANNIIEKKLPSEIYKDLLKIIVEGNNMKNLLSSVGFENVMTLPNFKDIFYVPQKNREPSEKVRFVFLSRVMPEKGADYIIETSVKLNSNYKDRYLVDIYGRIEPTYEDSFSRKISDLPNVNYKGFLSLDNKQGYDILSTYDVMLFPTYWQGEGFPGVIIDAFISGLPIIATNWNLNSALIKDEYNGMLIPVHSINSLYDAMSKVIKGFVDIKTMSINAQKEALKYDTKNVITRKLLDEIGL